LFWTKLQDLFVINYLFILVFYNIFLKIIKILEKKTMLFKKNVI